MEVGHGLRLFTVMESAERMMGGVQHDADQQADFEALFVDQFPRVASLVLRVVGDRAVAEEIAQDAFVQLVRHWGKVSGYERPDLWVRRVALRQAQRERHRAWRRPALERSGAALRVVEEPQRADDDVLRAVSSLAPKQRAIVVLFYFEDRPIDEIAELVGCSASTAWSQLHKARKHLAALLGEEASDDVDR